MGSPEFFYTAEVDFVYGQRASCSIQIDGPDRMRKICTR